MEIGCFLLYLMTLEETQKKIKHLERFYFLIADHLCARILIE